MTVLLYNDLSYCLKTLIGTGKYAGSLTGNGSTLEYKVRELDWCESTVQFHCLKDGSLVVKWGAKSLLDDVSFDEGFSVKHGKYPENLYSLVSEALGICERVLVLTQTYIGSVLTSKTVYDSAVRQAAVTYNSGVRYANDEALRGLENLKARVSKQ